MKLRERLRLPTRPNDGAVEASSTPPTPPCRSSIVYFAAAPRSRRSLPHQTPTRTRPRALSHLSNVGAQSGTGVEAPAGARCCQSVTLIVARVESALWERRKRKQRRWIPDSVERRRRRAALARSYRTEIRRCVVVAVRVSKLLKTAGRAAPNASSPGTQHFFSLSFTFPVSGSFRRSTVSAGDETVTVCTDTHAQTQA